MYKSIFKNKFAKGFAQRVKNAGMPYDFKDDKTNPLGLCKITDLPSKLWYVEGLSAKQMGARWADVIISNEPWLFMENWG